MRNLLIRLNRRIAEPSRSIETLLSDARYALRGFRRNPVFTASILITLGLGIGATTAVFSVVDRILFRPLPYQEADRIVSAGMVHSLEHEEFLMGRFYAEWQQNQKPFVAIAGQSTGVHNCDLVENNPKQVGCISFQAGFLPLFGISPVLGRNFLPEEDRPNGPTVVLISYKLWQSQYGRDPAILERTIDVDGNASRVVGVLPQDFQFPTLETADIVFPMALDLAAQQTVNGGFGNPMRLFGRLKPGVSLAQARAAMQPIFQSDLHFLPPLASGEVSLSIRSLRDKETQDVQRVAWVLLSFVFAVLLIACGNVASLLMARGAARQRDNAIRLAIGASRTRLIRQALTESLLLACAGGLVGLLAARALLAFFVQLAPTGIPFIGHARLDLRIAAFAALLSCVCSVVFGLASAMESPRLVSLNAKASTSRSHALLRRLMVTAQIAVTMVLLSGAGLLLRSFLNIQSQKLGMETGGVLMVRAALPSSRYKTPEKVMDFYLQLEQTLRRLPGTRAVSISDSVPPGGWQSGFRFTDLVVSGRPSTLPGIGGNGVRRDVTPEYFRALNIPIMRGRGFAEQDRGSKEKEVILSQSLAQRLFPDEDPIGKHVGGVLSGDAETVVGVAGNVKNSGLTSETVPEVYELRHNLAGDWDRRSILLLDSVMPAAAVEPWVHAAVVSIDPTVPIDMEPLDRIVNRLADRPRFETTLLAFFAVTGLLLAIVGLYGLIAFMTTQRQHEIGVRMALGATKGRILSLILIDGMRMVAIGGMLGLVVALAISRLLKSLLFGVSTSDPLALVIVLTLLALTALVAILIPARAGTRVDPAVTLRAE